MSIPINLYDMLERKFGREEAVEIVRTIEEFFKVMERKADELALQKKLELRDELVKELATKEDVMITKTDLRGEIGKVRDEVERVRVELMGEIVKVRTELEAKIENVRAELDAKIDKVRNELKSDIDKISLKLNLLIVLVIIVLTIMNPVVAEIIKKMFGIQ